MIQSVKVTNYLNESITLEMRSPENSGFRILKMEGISPGKATINLSESTTDDGAEYNSSHKSARNIILTLGFEDTDDVETRRQTTYKYFPLKKKVRLEFTTDNRHCEIYGFVESNEPDIFSKVVTTNVSILCPNPYFYSVDTFLTVFYGVISLFEFPFSNESLVDNLIEFGTVQNKTTNVITYNGDAEIGVFIEIHATDNASGIKIYNINTREVMDIDSAKLITLTGADITIGDVIYISTVRGNKYIMLLRDGEYINILNTLNRRPRWFQLQKGDNLFAYTAEEGMTNLQFKITNRLVYEGL